MERGKKKLVVSKLRYVRVSLRSLIRNASRLST
jgi:hypothetical protein